MRFRIWCQRQVIECLPDAVIMVDARGRIVLLNRRPNSCSASAASNCSAGPSRCWSPNVWGKRTPVTFRGSSASRASGPWEWVGTRWPALGRQRVPGGDQPEPGEHGTGPVRRDNPRSPVTGRKPGWRTPVKNIPAVTFIAPLDESVPGFTSAPRSSSYSASPRRNGSKTPFCGIASSILTTASAGACISLPPVPPALPSRRFIASSPRTARRSGSTARNVVRDPEGQLLFLQGVDLRHHRDQGSGASPVPAQRRTRPACAQERTEALAHTVVRAGSQQGRAGRAEGGTGAVHLCLVARFEGTAAHHGHLPADAVRGPDRQAG